MRHGSKVDILKNGLLKGSLSRSPTQSRAPTYNHISKLRQLKLAELQTLSLLRVFKSKADESKRWHLCDGKQVSIYCLQDYRTPLRHSPTI